LEGDQAFGRTGSNQADDTHGFGYDHRNRLTGIVDALVNAIGY
jgi:hypothetical protein